MIVNSSAQYDSFVLFEGAKLYSSARVKSKRCGKERNNTCYFALSYVNKTRIKIKGPEKECTPSRVAI